MLQGIIGKRLIGPHVLPQYLNGEDHLNLLLNVTFWMTCRYWFGGICDTYMMECALTVHGMLKILSGFRTIFRKNGK
jgi:hypothetical protein